MDLDAYRRTAETFQTELMREYYQHYAGLKETFEIEPIYARAAELFTRDAVQALRELDDRASRAGDERRQARMLLDFAVEGYVGEATKAVEEWVINGGGGGDRARKRQIGGRRLAKCMMMAGTS